MQVLRLEDETKDDVYVYPDHLMIIYFRYKTSKKRSLGGILNLIILRPLYTHGYRTIQALGPLLIINQRRCMHSRFVIHNYIYVLVYNMHALLIGGI